MYYEYPYTDLNKPNLDAIIRYTRESLDYIKNYTALNKVNFAGAWTPGKAYKIWSVVQDSDGNGYISVKPVPENVLITNTEYWQPVAGYDALYEAFNDRITAVEASAAENAENIASNASDITKIKANTLRVNIANFVDTLNNETFAEAFNYAVEHYKYIYIPAGTYNFDVIGKIEVSKAVIDILCSGAAVFDRPAGADFMFTFEESTVKWDGGVFRSGTAGSCVMQYASGAAYGYSGGDVLFKNCINTEIKNVVVPYNKKASVFVIEDCENTNIHNCIFDDCLLNCIHILYHCVNTVVDSCKFTNIRIPTTPSDIYYCYAVSTGAKTLTDPVYYPPDGLVYKNNYINGSEDSALDTHGARNVLIENNIILQCNTAITAYNDSNRVAASRPVGWVMENVIIRNNYCKSDYDNGRDTHPFILIANTNRNGRDSINYIIENNVFDTVNNNSQYNKCVLPVYRIQKCTIVNNVFKANKAVNSCIFVAASNCEINNNVFDSPLNQAISNGFSAKTYARNNEYINAENFAYQSDSYYNYLKNDDFNYSVNDKMVAYLNPVKDGDDIKMSITPGIAANAQFTNNSYECVLENGVLTCVNDLELVEGQRISLGAYVGTVEQLLSDKSARITTSAPNGNYTVTGAAATLVTIS